MLWYWVELSPGTKEGLWYQVFYPKTKPRLLISVSRYQLETGTDDPFQLVLIMALFLLMILENPTRIKMEYRHTE